MARTVSSPPRALLAVLLVVVSGCIGTRLVHLEYVDVPLPPADPQIGWRAEIAALFTRYESAPVLAPEDERLEPLFGGLTTLSYFGADAKARVRDQQLPPQGSAHGQPLASACAAPPMAATFASDELPAFSPLWIPLSIHGGAASAAARCDVQGHASGDPDSFCVFARLALQADAGRPLVVVVHGMFDSGAQAYLQRMAAALYGLGDSVLLPDMRDHGDTFRAAPAIATTLGALEGPDLLALVGAARRACGARIGRAGIAGVSGGGLDAIRAFALDDHATLDAGVIAVSPLLDVPSAIRDLSTTGACPITRAIELTWIDDAAIALAAGAAFFGGAALVQALDHRRLDGATAAVGGSGAGAGLLASAAIDAWFDGGSEPCVSQNAIAQIVQDALRVRWRTLQRPELKPTLSAIGQRIPPEAITLESYLRERAQFAASRIGVSVGAYTPDLLAHDLRAALAAGARRDARLLVIGAEDDPMTRIAALRAFERGARAIPQVYAHAVRHGGHGAIWIVQPSVSLRIFERFFASDARVVLPP